MGRLDGKVAIITGGANGQGAAEARLFHAEGAEVWIGDVDVTRGEALAVELGVQFRRLDVSDEAGWTAVAGEVRERHGRIDVLINNAGFFRSGRLTDTTSDDVRRHFEINQLGVFLGMQAVTAAMIDARRGSIVNISSAAGLVGMTNAIAYAATKWAVRGMSKCAAVELGRFGIRVNSIHPGIIDTDMLYQNPAMTREDMGPILRSVPLRRVAQPDEVASVALFLASDESSYCTGGEFAVDGGITAS